MSQPYLGQIQPFAFNFAPKNWAFCNGQILPVQQNAALFSLLGTMYGGNGTTTFALPNLQSRVPVHSGTLAGEPFIQGETAGAENVSITFSTMPSHNHAFLGTTAVGNSVNSADGIALATSTGGGVPDNFYGSDATPQPLNPQSIGNTGGGAQHTNLQPYLTINWCISMGGVFPSRN